MRRPLLRSDPQPDRLPDLRQRLQDRLLAGGRCRRPRGGEGGAQGQEARRSSRPAAAAEAEAEEALVDVEADETAAEEADETFLEEEEEEGGDVTNIIGGPVAEGEEP